MRKTDVTQHSLYSYRSLEERIPDAHPLRKLRAESGSGPAFVHDLSPGRLDLQQVALY
jgi:hypothetical protein